ncbi:uncharacterized protein LOC115627619 [Scaptodrosophila lebanonensis]|uniref:Uncharacterized protein LOC115627619 n=1 Tax=Drosophila lebanonensis TaxID=7225 RepID=A0A6J2TRC7_DROLE|nr:uncharacterized protein LOC115627619 [Scaptodrosophila lebanonensis]
MDHWKWLYHILDFAIIWTSFIRLPLTMSKPLNIWGMWYEESANLQVSVEWPSDKEYYVSVCFTFFKFLATNYMCNHTSVLKIPSLRRSYLCFWVWVLPWCLGATIASVCYSPIWAIFVIPYRWRVADADFYCFLMLTILILKLSAIYGSILKSSRTFMHHLLNNPNVMDHT